MEPVIQMVITILLSGLSAFLGIFSFTKNLKKDSASSEARVKELEVRMQNIENEQGDISAVQIAKMEQYVKELGKRVDKLDTDVEKKIDQLSVKLDKLTDKSNEMLIHLMNKK
jgi:outer membrane murein-binding lipoprotein Lpp